MDGMSFGMSPEDGISLGMDDVVNAVVVCAEIVGADVVGAEVLVAEVVAAEVEKT